MNSGRFSGSSLTERTKSTLCFWHSSSKRSKNHSQLFRSVLTSFLKRVDEDRADVEVLAEHTAQEAEEHLRGQQLVLRGIDKTRIVVDIRHNGRRRR